MAVGVDEAEWWHTAEIVSTIYAVVGIKREPRAIHPYEHKRNMPRTKEQIEDEREADAIVARAAANARLQIGGG